MKICFLAPADNYHTKKWCKWFTEHGHDVSVISFVDDKIENISVHYIDAGVSTSQSDSRKIKYLFKARYVKKIIDQMKPDIVSVHYATSYGTVAALSGLKGYTLSVWGSDVYEFPQKSFFHKFMLKFSLQSAEHIFSTSYAMADETRKYTNKDIEITPFGVDMQLFNPDKRKRDDSDGTFVVGIVKSLENVYGIEYLLKGVSIFKKTYNDANIELRVSGKGSCEKKYKELAKKLDIDEITTWVGFISPNKVAEEWANMDVAVIPSLQESFGVAAVEAQACGVPVIVTDIPGLMESTLPGKSSIVIKKCDEYAIADALHFLYNDLNKRLRMGKLGREYVVQNYSLDSCFQKISDLFQKVVEKNM